MVTLEFCMKLTSSGDIIIKCNDKESYYRDGMVPNEYLQRHCININYDEVYMCFVFTIVEV